MSEQENAKKLQENIETALNELRAGKYDNEGKFIELCLGVDETGRECWAYIAIAPSRYEEYKNLCEQNETFDIEDYGEVLEAGFNTLPPSDIQQKLKERFGLNYQMEAQFRAEIEQAQHT